MNQLMFMLYCNMSWRFLTGIQAQEGEALLCFTTESSTRLGEAAEPSETSRDTARSSDLRPARACQPAHTRTKHHSGSNVSFSHDTEGGEDDQTQVKPLLYLFVWIWISLQLWESLCELVISKLKKKRESFLQTTGLLLDQAVFIFSSPNFTTLCGETIKLRHQVKAASSR